MTSFFTFLLHERIAMSYFLSILYVCNTLLGKWPQFNEKISFRPIMYGLLLSQFVSSGKLKKHAEFAEHVFFGLMELQVTAHVHVIACYQCKTESNWVTRSVAAVKRA